MTTTNTNTNTLATQLRGYAVAIQDEQPYWADKIKAACDELEAQAEAKPAPSGFVLVPVEPTDAMFRAADKADEAAYVGGSDHGATASDIWAAMLAAAPAAPAQGVPKCWPDATNLARNMLRVHQCKGITERGVRLLCDAIMEMDEARAAPAAPAPVPAEWKPAFWVYEWLHPQDGSVTMRSLRPEDHCRPPDRCIPVPLMDEWVAKMQAAEKDAERYRWVSQNGHLICEDGRWSLTFAGPYNDGDETVPMSAAIDAAIAASNKEKA